MSEYQRNDKYVLSDRVDPPLLSKTVNKTTFYNFRVLQPFVSLKIRPH